MINKQGLWFLTLFSLVLVLSVYYITMPNEVFTKEETMQQEKETKEVSSQIKESNEITTLKIELEEKRSEDLKKLENSINDSKTTTEEKNDAYEKIKDINKQKAQEELIIKKIKENHNLESFVEVSTDSVKVVVNEKEHDVKLANKIMNTVQNEFQEHMNISVKFS